MDEITSLRELLPYLGLACFAGLVVTAWAGWSLWSTVRRSQVGRVVDGEVTRVISLRSDGGTL